MPYTMRKKGDQWCVFNKDTGESKGCSDTRGMAVKHMRALYANAGEKSKAWHPDASYLGQYIAYCNSLIEQAQYSFQYTDTEHEQLANFSEELIDTMSGYMGRLIQWRNDWYGSQDDFKDLDSKSIVQQVIDGLKGWIKPAGEQASGPGPVTYVKQADGRTRVFLRVSNNFKDRHGEIITEAAHRGYEQYVKESGDYPAFWLWHTPGSRWGQADMVSYDEGFLTMTGLVDQGKEYIAEGLARVGQELGVSHGFKGLSLSGKGYIDWYKSFEASPLPRQEAANLWTAVMIQEKGMALADKHKKFFSDIGVPESVIADWDKQNKDLGTMLKDAGITYKDLGVEEPGPKPEPKPDDKPKPGDEQATTEVVLPDGTKAMVPTQSIQSKALDGAPEWAKALVGELQGLRQSVASLEEKHKALESKQDDAVASTLEAAIQQGKGFVASKEGAQPSPDEVKSQDAWEAELGQLIMGGVK